MIGLRTLAAATLACVALASVACSSSSGSGSTSNNGGGGITITNPVFKCPSSPEATSVSAPASSAACSSCAMANCSAEVDAIYGSGYASGNFSGGACGPFLSCIAACACDDLTCLEGCTIPSACETAEASVGSCFQTKCPACVVDAGTASSSGVGSGSGTSSGGTSITTQPCDTSAMDGVCFQKGYTAAECTSEIGGTVVTSCPTANLSGCCVVNANSEMCYYGPTISTSDAMTVCTQVGTFQSGI